MNPTTGPRKTPAEDLQGQDDGRDPSAAPSGDRPDVSERPDPNVGRHDKGPKSGGMGPKQ